MNIRPITLEGKHVRLEPLSMDHLDGLYAVGTDEDLWLYTLTLIRNRGDMERYIESALQAQKEGSALPFAIMEKSSGRAMGSTRYGNIDRENKRVEIGWTWVARPWQRTAVNTECKYLLLEHAFERLGCMRVEFKTDSTNAPSRKALVRIGAKEEGTFRKHMVTSSGRIRHSVYYSIIDTEWPDVKKVLREKLS
ncbi:MAG: GNAT family N-acetyltransferase [Ignavibacteriales bacterium]|nr:GNAT family N-acetyltransferase [Ignavibacteriales bacterium]